jgi:hypothetical protein
MKRNILILIVACTAMLMSACRDRASEKKIAELESRLAEVEKNSKGASANNPNANSVNPSSLAADGSQVQPAQDAKPEGPLPIATFETVDHDFGTIAEGAKVSHTYKIKNTGAAPLIIQSAQPSCGCTAPDWTREPIPVGGTGFVKAEFDSKGKPGIQNKTITVMANTWPKTTTLKFKAMVTPGSETNGPTK